MQMGHQATESFWSELNNVTHFPQHGSALQINFFRKFGKFHMAVRCQKKKTFIFQVKNICLHQRRSQLINCWTTLEKALHITYKYYLTLNSVMVFFFLRFEGYRVIA